MNDHRRSDDNRGQGNDERRRASAGNGADEPEVSGAAADRLYDEPRGVEAPRHPEAEEAPYHPELERPPSFPDSESGDFGTVAEEVGGHRVFFGLLRRVVTLAIIAVPVSVFLLRAGWGMVGDGYFNRHVDERPTPLEFAARNRYRSSFVMDWHADSLLWNRDLEARSDQGHWDLPRAFDGGIDLQMLTIVSETREPLWLLAVAQEWPFESIWDPAERVEHQLVRARRLIAATTAAAAQGPDRAPRVELVVDRESLATVVEGRARGIILGLEGIHGIEDEPAALDTWYERGVRMAALVHRHDNAYGSSSGGSNLEGAEALTPAGRAMLERMRQLGMILDLSHASPGLIDEALAIYRDGPVVVSHTGLRAHCDSPRNLSDEQARRIAAGGGLVAIMFAPLTLCGDSLVDLVEAIRSAVALLGEDRVAFGSDWDGYVTTVIDAGEVPELMAALEASGLSPEVVRKVAGENSLRFLSRWLR